MTVSRTIRRNDPADQYPERVLPSSDDYRVRALRMLAILAVKADPPGSAADVRDAAEALGLIEPLKPSLSVVKPGPGPVTPKPAAGVSTSNSAPVPTPRKRRAPRDTSLCGKRRHAMTGDNVRIRSDGRRRCRACATDWAGGKRTPHVPRPVVVEEPEERMCGNRLHPLPVGSGECKPCKNSRARKKRSDNTSRREAAIARAREILAGFPFDEVAPVDEFGAPVRRCKKRIHHRPDTSVGSQMQCVPCHQIAQAKATLRRLAGETW